MTTFHGGISVKDALHQIPRGPVEPIYVGFAPIATCHWQSLANILATYGIPDALRIFGLSWGFRWRDDGILLGGGRWPHLVNAAIGVEVERLCLPDPETAESTETDLSGQALPFVAEVDAFYLPSPYQNLEHVVHTVVVTERTTRSATVLDTTNNPSPVRLPLDQYRRLREEPCEGRIEPEVLYVPRPTRRTREPDPVELAELVTADLHTHAEADLATLSRFIDWYARTLASINVCRVAAEHHQAALLFDYLAEAGISGAARTASALRDLSEAWYLLHMLTVHPNRDRPRQQQRILRLLRQCADDGRSLVARLTRR